MGLGDDPAVVKNILLINKVQGDGLGDLGHLVDIARAMQVYGTLPQQDGLGNPLQYQPILYIILSKATPKRLRFVLQSLIDNELIDNRGNPYDIRDNKSLLAFLAFIHKKNPHFILNHSEMRHKEYSDRNALNIPTTRLDKTLELAATCVISYCDEEVRDFAWEITIENACSCTQIFEHGKNARIHRSVPLSHFDHVYSMGLAPREVGLLLSPQPHLDLTEKQLLIKQMHNQKFVMDLLDNQPVSNDAMMYTFFVPCYWQKQIVGWGPSIIQTLATAPIAKDYKDIVFYVNDPRFMDFDENVLKTHGFNKIVIGNQVSSIPGASGDRCLRILNASSYHLDNHDYETLPKLATFFGGCSGDKTLERVLSNHLIPLYEEPRIQKVIIDSFIELAKLYLPNPENIVTYLKNLQTFNASPAELATKIDANFIAQWDLLIDKIYENHNCYEHLPEIMRKAINVNDFFCNRFTNFKNHLDLGRYAEAVETIHQARLDFFDLMSIIRNQLLYNRDNQYAAFIYQYVISTRLLEENMALGRTQEEMDKEVRSATSLLEGHTALLSQLSNRLGYDQIDFLAIENNRESSEQPSNLAVNNFLKTKQAFQKIVSSDANVDATQTPTSSVQCK